MATLADITGPGGLDLAEQIERSHVRLVWASEYWDGPKSGILDFNGESCWFIVIGENEHDDGWYRRFAILRLSSAQFSDETRWHELFRRCVGKHMDYYHDEQPPNVALEPRERWAEFYDAYQRRILPDYSSNEVLGWFEM